MDESVYYVGDVKKMDIIDEIKKLRTVEEVFNCLIRFGYDVTEEDAAKFFVNIHQDGDLAEEELANVGQGQKLVSQKNFNEYKLK